MPLEQNPPSRRFSIDCLKHRLMTPREIRNHGQRERCPSPNKSPILSRISGMPRLKLAFQLSGLIPMSRQSEATADHPFLSAFRFQVSSFIPCFPLSVFSSQVSARRFQVSGFIPHPLLSAFCFLLFPLASPAQEALTYSLAGQAAAEARRNQTQNQPYTVKSGDFRLLVTPSLGLDYNSNVKSPDLTV